MHQHTILAVVLTTSLTAAAGCGEAAKPVSDGSLTASWEISPRGCTGTDVETVQLDLKYKEGTRTESYPCEKGNATVENLPPANYRVRIWGIDAEGDPTFGAGPKKLTIQGAETTVAPHFRLTARPAEIRLDWRFENGMVCGANGVDKVNFTLYDTDDFKVMSEKFKCTKGHAEIDSVPPGEYLVELLADGEDNRFAGFAQVEASRGKTASAELVLDFVDK